MRRRGGWGLGGVVGGGGMLCVSTDLDSHVLTTPAAVFELFSLLLWFVSDVTDGVVISAQFAVSNVSAYGDFMRPLPLHKVLL